uniref:TFIIS-type domain-containing protein n=1 Tax=Suricata suricatta TaxID=37032 RepID=A0A673VKT7_SURSU
MGVHCQLFCRGMGLIMVEGGCTYHSPATPTGPAQHHLRGNKSMYPKLKEVDDGLAGAAAWKNVDSTTKSFPNRKHSHAYFKQLQTHSADQPMTTFYRCCDAQGGHRWRGLEPGWPSCVGVCLPCSPEWNLSLGREMCVLRVFAGVAES